MNCPRCGFGNETDAVECAACGVIMAKATQARRIAEEMRTIRPYVIEEERIADGRIGSVEAKILGFGFIAAVLAYAFPLTRFVLSAMVTLFHELGHAVAGWLMGYPSLPAFDFVYGGGLTHHGQFRLSIALAIAALFAYLIWLFRENRVTAATIAVLFLVWLVFVTREWRRELIFASAGHAFEFILSGAFFYMALSGTGWRNPDVERPLGAFIAFFVQIHAMVFAWKLATDEGAREAYRIGKGGAMMNDLEVVALDLQIWLGVAPGIEGVAKGFLIFALLPFVIALLWHFERTRWHRLVQKLRTAG
jgi:hypothetical protein